MQPLDALTLHHLAAELDVKLAGGKVNKIQQPSFNELLFHLWVGGETGRQKLYINIQPQYAFCCLLENTDFLTFPSQAPNFCMLLRKHLSGARIQKIETLPDERVLNIVMDNFNELGQSVNLLLSLELMGKHSNIILVDTDLQLILGCAHGVSEVMSRHREVSVGYPYKPPPSLENPTLRYTNKEAIIETIEQALKTNMPEKIMTQTYSGVGSALWRDIFAVTTNPLTAWQLLQEVFEGMHLYPAINQAVSQYSLISAHSVQPQWTAVGSINTMVAKFYLHHLLSDSCERKRHQLLQIVKHHEKKHKGQQQELEKSDLKAIEALKKAGDLLTLAYSQGQTVSSHQMVFKDLESEKNINLEVDIHLSLSENAQVYYRRYKKGQARQEKSRQVEAELQRQLQFIENIKSEIALGNSITDLAQVEEDLIAVGWLKPDVPLKKGQVKPVSLPLTLMSSDQFAILVGKNSLQNEQIVGKLSKPWDVWLHTQSMPGSHVLIRTEKKPLPEQTMLEACMLAVYFSQGRGSANVPVTYTKAKHVRKIPGSYPGHVTYTHEQAVYITADEAKIEQLLQSLQ